MGLMDELKKLTRPYNEEDMDEYDYDEEEDDPELEPEPAPAPRRSAFSRRNPRPTTLPAVPARPEWSI